MSDCAAIILAAGDSIRMKSAYPYVMLKLLSKPMISWVVEAAKKSGVDDVAIIVSKPENMVAEYVLGSCEVVVQSTPLGTAHAVLQAMEFIKEHKDGNILILNGDSPLMDAATIRTALMIHKNAENDVTVISAKIDKPFGYGRIVRDRDNGTFKAIVEEKDATGDVKRIDEISSGAYWFRAEALIEALSNLKPRANGEYNLVDSVTYLINKGCKADTSFAMTPDVVLGANDRIQLHQLNHIARMRELEGHLEAGVDIPCFESVMIDPGVQIGMDTTILSGTILRGKVVIGRNCIIGPNTIIENSTIGDDVVFNNVQCYGSTVKNRVVAGPYVYIKQNSVIGEDFVVKSFSNVKHSLFKDDLDLTYIESSDLDN
ncbi:MAG: sugar phosphate nucleotidyltransferase [Oscillospiraceae bacterium]